MPSSVSESYKVVKADLTRDRDRILAVWHHLADSEVPGAEKLDWFYINNPAGEGIIYLLWFIPENRPVGIICAGRRNFRAGAQILHGAVLGDFAMEPAHRSLGPSLLLQRKVMDEASANFDVFFGFLNTSSLRVRQAAGHQANEKLVDSIIPLRLAYHMKKRLPDRFASFMGSIMQPLYDTLLRARIKKNMKGYQDAAADRDFINGLWSRACNHSTIMGVRDWDFLSWRMSSDAGWKYAVSGLRDTHGKPCGYVAYEFQPNDTVVIVDYLALNNSVFAALLCYLIGQTAKTNAPSISICTNDKDSEKLRILRKLGFVARGESFAFVVCDKKITDQFDTDMIYLNHFDNDV